MKLFANYECFLKTRRNLSTYHFVVNLKDLSDVIFLRQQLLNWRFERSFHFKKFHFTSGSASGSKNSTLLPVELVHQKATCRLGTWAYPEIYAYRSDIA